VSDPLRPGNDLAALLTDPALYAGDPFPLYARLRSEAPVAWNNEAGFWAVTTHAAVQSISTDPRRVLLVQGDPGRRNRRRLCDAPDDDAHRPAGPHPLPPARPTRLQAGVSCSELEASVRTQAQALIDQIEPGAPVDVVQALSVPFPLQVICGLLGVDGDQWPRFYEWSEAAIPGAAEMPDERRQELMTDMWVYLVAVAKRAPGRRRAPMSFQPSPPRRLTVTS